MTAARPRPRPLFRAGLPTLLALAFAGCVGASRAEGEPIAAPRTETETETADSAPRTAAPAAAPAAAPGSSAGSSEASPAEPTAAPAPAPRADSKIPAHLRKVGPDTQPGLAEFAGALRHGGALWIGRLAGNGGRDVLVYIPPHADDGADFRLVYHFHGTHSQNVQRKAPGVPKKKWVGWDRLQQTIDAADELQAERDYNVALVYPFSAGKRPEPTHRGWFNKDYDRMWMAGYSTDAPGYDESFDDLHAQVVQVLTEELGVHESRIPARVLAEGHSAGGMPLFHIAASGSKLVEEYLFLDASFQGWGDGCWQALRDARIDAMVTMVVTRGGIADPFGKRDPWCTQLEADAALHAEHATTCAREPGHRPAGSKSTCEELAAAAEEWNDRYREWCEGMKVDMKDTPGARVLRTRVVHGDQPRHFTGGLELPESFRSGAR